MQRREALSRLSITTAGLVVLPAAFVSCEKTDPDPVNDNNNNNNNTLEIDLSKSENSALTAAGGFLISGNIIVINTGSDVFIALSKVCTHSGCAVTYSASNNNLPCPCHGSVFGIDGTVLNGPAATPLKKYMVTRSGDILLIN